MPGAVYAKVAGAWGQVYPALPSYNDATGGSVSTKQIDGTWYRFHEFTADATFTVLVADRPFKRMLIGGGGGGGCNHGGGGGAGGALAGESTLAPGDYPVVTGAGGAGGASGGAAGGKGGNTTFAGLTAEGGGGGGGRINTGQTNRGQDGGSGGGGAGTNPTTAGSGTPGQGYNGGVGTSDGTAGNGGGGGGAAGSGGAASGTGSGGGTSGAGGQALTWLNGKTYGGGGAGGRWASGAVGAPGAGGGAGGAADSARGGDATRPGSGGGGGGGANAPGGAGSRGAVVIAYEIAEPPPAVYNDASGGTVTEATRPSGEVWRTHRFAAGSGVFTVNEAPQPFTMILSGGARGGMSSACCGSCASPMESGGTLANEALTLVPGDYAVSIGSGGGGGPWPAPCTGGNCSPNAGAPGGASSFGPYSAPGGGAGGNGPAVTSDIEGASKQYVALSHGGGCGDHVSGGRGDDGFLYVSYRIG